MIVPWQVGMYPHHGGDNQVWRLEEGGVISTQLDPALVLVVGEGGAVVLGPRAGAGQSWGAGEGGLLSWGDTGLVLTQQCGGGVGAAPPREECPHQSWDLVPAADMDTAATPATSCHLRYPLPGDVSPHVSTLSMLPPADTLDTCQDWELRCSVTVSASTPATYFCVVGWGPAGYSGIQEVTEDRKVAS